ncbi:MAG: TIGR03087 family PEP-CTERM/XrtA system glycosyltransferase [Candidatus Competibacterales bacterium]
MNAKPPLLFLAHRLPYPPDKGDKIRSYHWLRHLQNHYRIFLGAFVDDPKDWAHRETLEALCAGLHLEPLNPRWAKVRALVALAGSQPVTLPYYRSRRIKAWVERVVAQERPTADLAFSGAMSQYLDLQNPQIPYPLRRVVDFVDVDSDKWRQYGAAKGGPMGWLYRREGRTLLAFERRIAAAADVSTFISDAEVALFARLAPESPKAVAVANGVDADYFDPAGDFDPADPFDGAPTAVFVGVMDYWANVDAVGFFAREVWPLVRRAMPEAQFAIVGAKPAPEVQRLGALAGVTVIGKVPDVRPYLANARLSVATLRLARGVQNKVLEAMAMALPVLATPQALEGIDVASSLAVATAEDPDDLARRTLDWLRQPVDAAVNRRWIQRHYTWRRCGDALRDLLVPGATPTAAPHAFPVCQESPREYGLR